MSSLELPVVLSQYDPEGRFLCYVTVALNKQRVSVQPADPGALFNESFLYLDDPGLKVCSLKWGCISTTDTLCVFLGLNNGQIWVYSPAANEIVFKLSTGNSSQINDLAIGKNETLWCVDSEDYLYRFSLSDFSLGLHFQIASCVSLNKLCLLDNDPDRILVASHSIFLVDINTRTVIQTYPGHTTPVCHLAMLTNEYFVTGAASDRFLNVYDLQTASTKTVLVLQSNLLELSHSKEHCIAVTTEDGDVELFSDPLVPNVSNNKRRGNKSKQCSKTIHATYNLNSKISKLSILNVSINRDIVNLVWLQNATIPNFVLLKWQDLPIDHTLEISANRKELSSGNDRSLYGTELSAVTTYKEGNARVTHGDNFKHVNDAIKEWEIEVSQNEIEDNDKASESLADKLELTSLNVSKKKASAATTAGTVTVILSQALQSNDHSLLETVLNNRDERVIRDTIFRLKPPLAVILLERLAERIARQAHRQGPLNVWVKWCLVIHGGYLVSIPNLMSSLSSLHSTLKRRSALLPRLLALEARLESTLNKLYPTQDIDGAILKSSQLLDEQEQEEQQLLEEEEDVEYNEELDDAGLIEDGEEDEEDDEEDEEGEGEENYEAEQGSRELPNGTQDKKSTSHEDASDDEAGYSDVEM